MRTTLTIDDALAQALKDLAQRSDKPFKQVVNETLRAGLSGTEAVRPKRYRVKPASLGSVHPGVNLDKALALADAIERKGSSHDTFSPQASTSTRRWHWRMRSREGVPDTLPPDIFSPNVIA